MRQILFRGKQVDNGEWVEGNLFIPDKSDTPTQICIGTNVIRITYDIDPSTVGQYTGLTDKNGRKIFEGDVVKTQPFYDRPYSDKRKSKQFIGVVEYKIKTFGGNRFYSKQDYHAEWGLKIYEDFNKYNHYSWDDLWNCEVIGNIHDNPELMEVEE